ncbi:MAG TPA: SDR family NAD(P)-dependent oxidoreductase [Thermoleophilaceae bacterium]|nr:SDR family NAD(P)-dependent oxidoreductase [Thermoleophilaceae bacterium]
MARSRYARAASASSHRSARRFSCRHRRRGRRRRGRKDRAGGPPAGRRRALRHGRPLRRRGGYFLSTASAAGLLTAIGSAPYSVSKHAAVAFAEWLSITYGDRGVRVSCLCPMGVDTALLSAGLAQNGAARLGSQVIVSTSEVLQPEQVAEAALEGLRAERFLILPHAEAHEYELGRVADRDAWIAAMRRLQAHHLRELESVA